MQEKNSTQDPFASPPAASLPYLEKRRAEAGGIITLCLAGAEREGSAEGRSEQ